MTTCVKVCDKKRKKTVKLLFYYFQTALEHISHQNRPQQQNSILNNTTGNDNSKDDFGQNQDKNRKDLEPKQKLTVDECPSQQQILVLNIEKEFFGNNLIHL